MTEKIQRVCPACDAINQFSPSKSASEAKCGKCRERLLYRAPVEVDSVTIKRYVKHSDLPVLVDFWAPWCNPCQMFAPTYRNYAEKQANQIICLKLNTEENQQSGIDYNIRSIPTLALFENGLEVQRISGAMNESQLHQWVTQNCSK